MEKVLATISDVARLSGMSVSTVSRVINNKPHVSEEKRQKILEAMDALGYSPLQDCLLERFNSAVVRFFVIAVV